MIASAQVQSHNPMKKSLGPTALVLLCLGHIIGSGIFVLTGVAAHSLAGPAIILSYGVGAIVAGLAALAYAELGTQFPLAGASFNYILVTFGEFPAWLTVMTGAADSIMGGGAMARSWSSYLAVMCHKPSGYFQIHAGPFELDFVAAGVTLAITAILVSGSLNTAWVNGIGKVALITIIAIVLGLSYDNLDIRNWDDFFPFGAKGIFNGAAVIYFSYGGYNACCNFAEEARNPKRDLPIALFTSLGVSTILYLLMAAAITLIVPWQLIDVQAPFSEAFITLGLNWAAQLVSIGAVIAIGSVLLVSMMATTREFLVMARHNLIPAWLAEVHPTLGTPHRVIISYGIIKSVMALLTDFETLAKLTSVGTMFVTGMVAASLIMRRYHEPSVSSKGPVLARLLAVVASAFVFAAMLMHDAPLPLCTIPFTAWLIAALSFYTLPEPNRPQKGVCVPLAPVLMSTSILGSSVLMLSLGWTAMLRSAVVFALVIILYVVYGVHAAAKHDEEVSAYMTSRDAEEARKSSSTGQLQKDLAPQAPLSSSPSLDGVDLIGSMQAQEGSRHSETDRLLSPVKQEAHQ